MPGISIFTPDVDEQLGSLGPEPVGELGLRREPRPLDEDTGEVRVTHAADLRKRGEDLLEHSRGRPRGVVGRDVLLGGLAR